MDLSSVLGLIQTALELGLICSATVLALYLSYTMLNVCDLSTDGCFTLGAVTGAVTAMAGHPVLAIFAAMGAGLASGLVVSVLQTRMGINSLLAGIIVNTALYSINIAIMDGASLLSLNKTQTVFTLMKAALIVLFLTLFLRTRMGLANRATGNNPDMVRSSSINPAVTTTIGLCIAGSFTALSGCLLAQYQKAADINIGQGMVTIALASLLIGSTVLGRGGILLRAVGAVLGAVIFRLVYTVALRLDMPAFMLKLVSAVIVVLAISIPYLKTQLPVLRRRMQRKAG